MNTKLRWLFLMLSLINTTCIDGIKSYRRERTAIRKESLQDCSQ